MERDKNDPLVKLFLNFLEEIENDIQKNSIPTCLHCGAGYKRDLNYCGHSYNTWEPNCKCINKSTIRVTTGTRND